MDINFRLCETDCSHQCTVYSLHTYLVIHSILRSYLHYNNSEDIEPDLARIYNYSTDLAKWDKLFQWG